MAFTIPFTEPGSVTVGDRIQWKRNLPAYPATAEGWTLTYYLRANVPNGIINITASADGDNHEVDVATTVSTDWIPATYSYQSFATKSGDQKPVGSGSIVICPYLGDVTATYDGRSVAKRILDAINATMENRASRDEQRYVLQAVGRSLDRITIPDLILFRNYWLAEVQKEEVAAKIAAGKNTGRNVLIRFNSP